MNTTNNGTAAKTDMDGLIAIDSALNGAAGRITLWRLDGEMSLDKLREAWVAEALDEAMLCESETPAAALKAAVRRNVERSVRRMLRPLEGRKGWGSVKETAAGDDLAYDVGLVAKLDVAGRPVITSTDEKLVEAITASYFANLDTISSSKAGTWLSKMVHSCDAVSLKDTGGAYYVPPHAVPVWEAMRRAIHAATNHRIQRIPAMRCEETIEAVLDAITVEASEAVTTMQKEITENELGAKALSGKRYEGRATELESKLARYEGILGTRLGGLRDKLDDVRATIAAALLAAAPDMKT
jgi:hypothetical protein